MEYDVILEETYQPEYSRAYQSQTIVSSKLSLMDAMLVVSEFNKEAKPSQYFFYRESK